MSTGLGVRVQGLGFRIQCSELWLPRRLRRSHPSRPASGFLSDTQTYLTECIYQLVLESQLLHQIVNLTIDWQNRRLNLSISNSKQ